MTEVNKAFYDCCQRVIDAYTNNDEFDYRKLLIDEVQKLNSVITNNTVTNAGSLEVANELRDKLNRLLTDRDLKNNMDLKHKATSTVLVMTLKDILTNPCNEEEKRKLRSLIVKSKL